MANRESTLMAYYEAMLSQLGPSSWWPAENPFEVAVGAILTQNTSWVNVSKAIISLKEASVLNPSVMLKLPEEHLSELIRSAGYYRLKATRLMNFLRFLESEAPEARVVDESPLADANMNYLRDYKMYELREKLLEITGIGPETADSILLYALNKSSFVVDTYTRRIFSRHGLVETEISYEDLRDFFMDVLPPEETFCAETICAETLYNEYHALLVRVGNNYCLKRKPRCELCPLRVFLEHEPDF